MNHYGFGRGNIFSGSTIKKNACLSFLFSQKKHLQFFTLLFILKKFVKKVEIMNCFILKNFQKMVEILNFEWFSANQHIAESKIIIL